MRILRKNLCLLMLLLISCPLSIFAQNKTITGTVRDAMDVVIGASVTVKGNNSVGTITDIDGNFKLSVPASAKELVVSFVGYDNQTVLIGSKTHFDITLKESSVMLDEVVAIGYAKVKRRDLTGATSSVSAGELAAVPVMTAAQALQGKAAGVNIVTAGGAPGAKVEVTVRGGTSITQSTKPLYIVDGFEMEDALTNIDINDIENIDILKDDRTQEEWEEMLPKIQGEIYALVYKLGGRLSGEHGIGYKREALLEKYTDPVELKMMKAVKKALDPKNIMNPGKVVSINDEVPVEE